MTKTATVGHMKVKSALRAGKLGLNANRRPLAVKAGLRAGRIALNANRRLLAIA